MDKDTHPLPAAMAGRQKGKGREERGVLQLLHPSYKFLFCYFIMHAFIRVQFSLKENLQYDNLENWLFKSQLLSAKTAWNQNLAFADYEDISMEFFLVRKLK